MQNQIGDKENKASEFRKDKFNRISGSDVRSESTDFTTEVLMKKLSEYDEYHLLLLQFNATYLHFKTTGNESQKYFFQFGVKDYKPFFRSDSKSIEIISSLNLNVNTKDIMLSFVDHSSYMCT